MTAASHHRLPHASLDPESRRLKALKIEKLLGLGEATTALRLLEIGTGSGVIAEYFSTHPSMDIQVTAVDVVDQRLPGSTHDFQLVDGPELSLEDESFDVVISNHVIEHVGGESAQRAHLSEIARVMRPVAKAYLATPNRWAVVEPHYELSFLSWLPEAFRSSYLRSRGRGDHYDCRPLSPWHLDRLCGESGLNAQHVEPVALTVMADIEGKVSTASRLIRILPKSLVTLGARLSPTIVCVISKASPVP